MNKEVTISLTKEVSVLVNWSVDDHVSLTKVKPHGNLILLSPIWKQFVGATFTSEEQLIKAVNDALYTEGFNQGLLLPNVKSL
jgi:hypothetical protein